MGPAHLAFCAGMSADQVEAQISLQNDETFSFVRALPPKGDKSNRRSVLVALAAQERLAAHVAVERVVGREHLHAVLPEELALLESRDTHRNTECFRFRRARDGTPVVVAEYHYGLAPQSRLGDTCTCVTCITYAVCVSCVIFSEKSAASARDKGVSEA